MNGIERFSDLYRRHESLSRSARLSKGCLRGVLLLGAEALSRDLARAAADEFAAASSAYDTLSAGATECLARMETVEAYR